MWRKRLWWWGFERQRYKRLILAFGLLSGGGRDGGREGGRDGRRKGLFTAI